MTDFEFATETRVSVQFGDVVANVNEYYRPLSDGVLPYVAGPHIDAQALRPRFGSTSDDDFPPTFKRKFRAGDVLLHSRGIEKLAVVNAVGVTGEKLFVLRSISPKLEQTFLPFLLLAPNSQKHLQSNFTGSVNKFLNWKPLADWHVELPLPDEQIRIAAALWAAENHRYALTGVLDRLLAAKQAFLSRALDDGGRTTPLAELVRKDTVITYGIVQAGPEVPDGIPYIRVSDMATGALSLDGMQRTSPDIASRFARSRVEEGDLVVALRGRIGFTLPVPPVLVGANLTQGTARVAVDPELVSPEFIVAVMNSTWMRAQIARHAKGSTFSELTLAALRKLEVPRLSTAGETSVVSGLARYDVAKAEVDAEIAALADVRDVLLQEVFG